MAAQTNTDSDVLLPPDEQIKRNKESVLTPSKTENTEQKAETQQVYKSPEDQIAENKASVTGESFLPPDQQIAQNKTSVSKQKQPQEDNSLIAQASKFDPENPDYMIQDYINNTTDGKAIYELHKANPKLKFGVKQSLAMMDYYNSPQNTDRHPFVNAATGLANFFGKAYSGVGTTAKDVADAAAPLSFLTGIPSTALGMGEAGTKQGMFAPSDSYDSQYTQWAMQAYAAQREGRPVPPKPQPPKEGEKSVYYQSLEDEKAQEDYLKKYAEWSKNAEFLDYITGKGMPEEPKYKQAKPTETEKLKEVGKDIYSVGGSIGGVPLEVYQMARKAQEGGIELADNLGLAIDESGLISWNPKSKAEKLVNFMTRNDIDADRARVNAKAPSNIGKILYYAGEAPTEDGGQQSYAQLLRPLLASYLVPSVKERMLKDPTLTEGQATQQWMKDSQNWGSATLQKWASQLPKEKEDVATAAQLFIPEANVFGPAMEALNIAGKGFREAARLNELESLLPQAMAMTDIAQTAREGGTFLVDERGNITAAPKENAPPRTKEQMREDKYNSNLLHKDLQDKIEAERLERGNGTEIKLGPWGVPKPYLWANGISQNANAAADALKKYATTGALGTAIPFTTGAIGAYGNRNEGPLGMAAGFLKGVEYGAAGELAGYGALRGIGSTAGVLADLGKVQQGLRGTGGNVFQIAGNLPTSTKATQNLFGGKIGKISSPVANWFAQNLVPMAYGGIEAGTLAAAMGIIESTPHEDMPSEVANGMAMMMIPHIISSAIHESPTARENRIRQENASIYYAKKDASDETKRNMNDIRDYRNVVNNQRGIVAQKYEDLRTLVVNPKSKPEDIKKAQEDYQQADDKLTQFMSANSETMREYGRQQDLLFSNIHRGLNGPLLAGQSNVGLEVLTKDQILQRLIDQNKELASTPQGMAKLEMIASQDGFVVTSAGGIELRAGTDLADALKNDPIMFDPSKTTGIINMDNAKRRAGIYGSTIYDALTHEGGHLYGRTEEFQKTNSELLSALFSTNIYHDDGTIASQDTGMVSNEFLKDLMWNNYLRGRTDEKKKAWLSSQGMWDEANNRMIDKEVIPYMREEYIAEMAGNSLHSMVLNGGETALMRWARTSNSNNMLGRAVNAVLGVGGPNPMKPSPVLGIEFTPEIQAATQKSIQAVNDYNGHIAPVIDSQPTIEISQKDMKKNKGLLKKYGVNSGMYQTQVYATIRNAKGEVVSKVSVANPSAAEGSWKVDPSTGRPVQTKGYGQIPDEVNNVQIPEGGSITVTREVAMQPDGESPIMLSDSQIKKNQKARRDLILNALGITGEIPEEGITWRGTFTPDQIQNIKNLPENVVPKAIKDVILSMNETLASGEGQRWLAEYSPTSGKKGKRKSLMMKQYDVVPIGMHFTKDGNFNVTVISATRLFNKIHAWGAEFPHILDMWNGSKSEFFNDFVTKYLANWQAGREGWEGLDADETKAKLKRDIFNNFLNLKDKDTEFKNQNRFYLKGKQADLDRTIMSMRADHVSSLQKSNAQNIPVDYYKAKINAMPESGLPYEERPEEGETAPRVEEERRPSAIDLGITAAHSKEEKPFGVRYVSPQRDGETKDDYVNRIMAAREEMENQDTSYNPIAGSQYDYMEASRKVGGSGLFFMPASMEIREEGTKQHLEFFDRELENSGIKAKPATMAALDAFIHNYVGEKYGAYVYGGAPPKGELFPKIDPEKIKNYYQKVVRNATPAQAADFPPDWLRIRNMSQQEFDNSFNQDRVDEITQFRVNALAKSANYLLWEMKESNQTDLQKKINEINDAFASGDIGLWEEKQAELEKLNGDTYENLRNQAFRGSYTPAEVAAILNTSAKFRVNAGYNESGEMVPLIQNISNGNEAVPNEVSGATASKIADYMRQGMSSKEAYTKGVFDVIQARVKKRGVFTGWKKYDQSSDMGDAETLNADCAGTKWCTGGSVGTANSHLSGGDFYLYFDQGEPQVAIRTDNGQIAEVRGRGDSQNITKPEYDKKAEEFIRSGEGPTGGESYLYDRDFRKMAVQVMETGKVPEEAYKYYNQLGIFIPPRARMARGDFDQEYIAPFRDHAPTQADIFDEKTGVLKTSYDYSFRDKERDKYRVIKGDINFPQGLPPIGGGVVDLPNLEECGNIDAASFGSVSLPKLKKSGFLNFKRVEGDIDIRSLETSGDILVNKYRYNLNLPQLKNCADLMAGNVKSINAPNLEECRDIDFTRRGEIYLKELTLPKLEKAGRILADYSNSVVLPRLKECTNLFAVDSGYLYAPELKKVESINGAKTTIIPKIDSWDRIKAVGAKEVVAPMEALLAIDISKDYLGGNVRFVNSDNGRIYDFDALSKPQFVWADVTPNELPPTIKEDTLKSGYAEGTKVSAAAFETGHPRNELVYETGKSHEEIMPFPLSDIEGAENRKFNRIEREGWRYGFEIVFPDGSKKFVSRREAFKVAKAAGQLREPKTEAEKVDTLRGVLHSDMVDYEGKSGISFMPASKLDEAHAKAIESGDMEEAQRLVDEKAKEMGFPIAYPLYRGIRKKLNESRVMQTQGGRATLSFTDVPEVAKLYTHDRDMFGGIKPSETGSVKKVYLNLKNPLDLREYGTKVNLGEIIENYTNYDFRPNTEEDPNTTFTIEDLKKLFVRLQKLEKSTQFESDIQASDNEGMFRLRHFGDVREAIQELIDNDDADLPEKIDNILQGIELDTYALADNQWFIKALKQRGYDGLIHKDTIEAGKEFFNEQSVAGKPIEEVKGIDVEDDYSHDTYRPFESSQIKLSDPATYDDQGNLIPLSQRFNQQSNDIRFMPKSDDNNEKYDASIHDGGINAFKEKLKSFVYSLPDPSEENYDFHIEKDSTFGLVLDYFSGAFDNLGARYDEHGASTGSKYIHISIPTGEGETLENTYETDRENHKITIRNHDVSVFRAREFGFPTKVIQVDNFDTKENVLKAATRLSDHLANILEPYREYLAEKAKAEGQLKEPEDGKVDWEGFKTKTQETAKPLAGIAPIGGISFKPEQQIELDKADAVQKAGFATKLPKKVPASGHYTIAMQLTDDGREVQYQVDPTSTITPKVGSIEDINGEQVGMLEADRHTTRGDNMGGPLHPFLISNQVIARLLDGRGFKPVWANMNAAFVTRAKNIIKNTTSGRALIQLMKEEAHISNRKFVNDVMSELDKKKESMPKEIVDSLHVILELGARNPAKKLKEVTKAQKAFKDGDITQRQLNKVIKDNQEALDKYGPMVAFLAKLGSIKSKATKGNIDAFNKAYSEHIKSYQKQDWYKKIAEKYKDTKFADEAARFTFNQRGAAMKRLRGIAHAPDISKMLEESMDFKGGKNLDLVASVQLSKDPDAFAIYTSSDPKQEAKMSENERYLRDQFIKNPKFKKHPSYDWMMLGPQAADNFILEKPVDPLVLFPDYAKNHPKKSVRNGSKETIVGTMKKSKIPLKISKKQK